ncbi:MAG TPA: SAM-dependent chlorinase/fluorinase, partial [Bryobacterales bacterium]|nr:SAM-dependent chlorinase/fluorinase [Bryobacterales bacterium]
WLFVAPDNGVLELVYQRHPHRVWALDAEQFALKPISNTFHGRDVFALAAAMLAKGAPPDQLGQRIEDFARLEIPQPREIGSSRRRGQVLKADRFGNLVTNLRLSDLPERFRITVGNAAIATLRPSYAAAAPGEVFAIEGSSGYVEISVNRASAAEITGARAGAAVEVVEAGGGE